MGGPPSASLTHPQNPKAKPVPLDVDFFIWVCFLTWGIDWLPGLFKTTCGDHCSIMEVQTLNLILDGWNKLSYDISVAFWEHLDGDLYYRKKGNEERDFYLPKLYWSVNLDNCRYSGTAFLILVLL